MAPLRRSGQLPDFMDLSEEVAKALASNGPVVALESTIITHGMPYPQNLQSALEVERVVREAGSIPATIAIMKGRVKVGLAESEINEIAERGPSKCSKVSIRDIGLVMANEGYGSTTVAATMRIAAMAGIRIFATGGIGGVHRGVESTWDVSADLTELGSTPVAVVCAGAKSVLDLPKTLEFLETEGVPVLGWGTDIFPAFFTRDSGLRTSGRVDDADHAAKFLAASDRFFAKPRYKRPGCIIGCPVPETGAADMERIEVCTKKALKEAENKGIQGAAVTPFLLKRINELTGGESLAANLSLIENNAKVASQIAVAYQKLRRGGRREVAGGPRAVAVLGGIAMDITAKASDPTSAGAQESTVPGFLSMSSGGVGLSLAESMAMLGATPGLISAVGRDSHGEALMQRLREIGVPTTNVKELSTESTGTCTLVLDGRGELISGVAAMDIFDRLVHPLVNIPKVLRQEAMSQLRVLLVDANMPRDTIARAAKACRSRGVECWLDPVSTVKAAVRAGKASDTGEEILSSIDLISPNMRELAVLASSYLYPSQIKVEPLRKDEVIQWGLATATLLLEKSSVRRVLASFGKHGVLLVAKEPLSLLPSTITSLCRSIGGTLRMKALATASPNTVALHYVSDPIDNMVSSTGAGDNLLAGAAWAYACQGVSVEKAVMVGMATARMSLFSESACHPDLSSEEVEHLLSEGAATSKL